MALETGLRGKMAVITGGSAGIGRAIADALAAEGVDLHLAARTAASLEAAQAALEQAHGVSVTCHPLDLARSEDQTALAGAAPDADILVNCAGAIPGGRLDEIAEPQWREAWNLKVFGTINLSRAYYGLMKARGRGVIVNIIGSGGEKPVADYICGAAGNAALMAFTRALGGSSPRDNIRVIGLNPGATATDRLVALMKKSALDAFGSEDRYTELLRPLPWGRAADVREIAGLAVFLASDLSGYTSGTVMTVDGGRVNRGDIF